MVLSPHTAFDVMGPNTASCLHQLASAGQWQRSIGGARCGGVQYRFMFAPVGERWTLAKVHWWGGWAENKQVSTFPWSLVPRLNVPSATPSFDTSLTSCIYTKLTTVMLLR